MIPLSVEDRALLHRSSGIDPHLRLSDLDDATITAIVRAHSQEAATAVVFDRLTRSPHCLDASALHLEHPAPDRDLCIGLVPGAFYDRHPHTGADGQRILDIARTMGFTAERIPIHPFGSPGQNAEIIAQWLSAQAHQSRPVLLVTLSKGSLDALEAMHQLSQSQSSIILGWLSLSGLWNGTALVNWLDDHPFYRVFINAALTISGRPRSTLQGLRRSSSPPPPPAPLPRIISIVGFPLRRHFRHHWAPKAYDRLSGFGPSDGGGLLLADTRHFPGEVCPLWGVDHYLNPDWDISPLIAAALFETLQPPATRTPNPPQPQAAPPRPDQSHSAA
jgi:hypothetical protein